MAEIENYSIETNALTIGSQKNPTVRDLGLKVPGNSVFALLGPSGSGKSALLRTLMNLSRPAAGEATVAGVPSVSLKPRHFARIGYVSRERSFPDWMEAGAFLAYCREFYPDWDDELCAKLTKSFQIKENKTIKSLSPGFRAKLALVSALAYRPSLLLLDEPFADVESRERDAMIRGIMELIDLKNWSIVIASREIDEVERMADWIGLLNRGGLEFSEPVAALQRRFRRVEAFTMATPGPLTDLPASWLNPVLKGQRLQFVDSRYDKAGTAAQVRAFLGDSYSIEDKSLSVREIYQELDKAYGLSA